MQLPLDTMFSVSRQIVFSWNIFLLLILRKDLQKNLEVTEIIKKKTSLQTKIIKNVLIVLNTPAPLSQLYFSS